MDAALRAEVERWIDEDPDPLTREQLSQLLASDSESELKPYFSGFLEFGTAGLRGELGPGPSRMNRAVVSKTALGLAQFMKKNGLNSIVIGRDARYGSEDFTRDTAEIMSGAGFQVYVLPRPLPTPVLAYAVRKLSCDVGVMVTASHNPPRDNGYKVYLGGNVNGINYNGSQIITPTDKDISSEIAQSPHLKTVPRKSNWDIVEENLIDSYIKETSRLAPTPAPISIVYTAMHGVGKETLVRVFKEAGFGDIHLVLAQAEPDPDFPTVAFPNPEEPGAIDLALELARARKADLVIANDPDADRCAGAIYDPDLGWRMLRGDEVGALLGEYIASKSKDKSAVLANSIVSSSILSKIAAYHQMPFEETLTGFKYLSKVGNLAFGYEEALGYAVDSKSVNDKDGISAGLLLAQLASDLSREGRTIANYLDDIWQRYGFHGTRQISVRTTSTEDIGRILGRFRNQMPDSIAGYPVTSFDDLERPAGNLPPTNGVRFFLDGRIRVIVRPSGTEPKIKCYLEVVERGEIRAAKKSASDSLDKVEEALRTLMTA